MEEFQVKILASDHPFYEGKCYSLVIPTLRGMYGIHAHHSNMITAIIPGTLQYQIVPGAPLEAAVSNGLAKVENGEVLILVDTAERPEEIDANRARRDADALSAELSAQLEDALARELQGRGEVLNATFTSSVSGSRLIVTMRAECREDIAVFTPAEQA